MKKSKSLRKKREISPDWREHLHKISQARTERKTEACRDNLALARERKALRRLGLWPPDSP